MQSSIKRTILKAGNPVMKICMMGPKAVGKTTVLTAVFNETQNSIMQTKLNLTAKGDTCSELTQRLHMLRGIFAKKYEIIDNPNGLASSGISATSYESRFDFGLGHIGQEPIIDLIIKDFPGEKVINEQQSDVIQFIKESQCVFIAIDTPHLMEEAGRFNEVKNKPKVITHLFRDALSENSSEKLVILIPLKCEKYFNNGKMSDVLDKVKESYGDLINLLSKKENICCCVSPILTLGDVEFDTFSFDENRNIKIAADGCPEGVKYKYAIRPEEKEPKYSPLFCSQPLYAMLSFVAAQYKREEKRRNVLDRLRNLLWKLFNSDKQLFEEILKIEKHRISDSAEIGYQVLCGGDLFHYNH